MKTTRFPNTQWSLVGRAFAPDEAIRRAAVRELLMAYRPGLRGFLIEGRRLSADTADDLLQDFIADKILTHGFLSLADRERGKFRSFLLASLNHFVTDRLRRSAAISAKLVGLDEADHVAAEPDAGLRCFEMEWAKQVVRLALSMMEAYCAEEQRLDIWEIFRLRVVEPALHEAEPASYEHLVERFRLESPGKAMNLLASAKRVYARYLRAAIKYYVPNDENIDQEITDLREICLG